MLIKVNYDATTGEIIGFYPDNIRYSAIPKPYIEIDELTHMDCINNPGKRHVDLATLKIIEYTPSISIDNLQAAKWAEIKAIRDKKEESGFTYLSKVLDSDSVAVQRITVAVQAAQAAISANKSFLLDWTCQDNTVLSMSAEQVVGMASALANNANTLHETARKLRTQIEAAETAEQVAAVVWPEG